MEGQTRVLIVDDEPDMCWALENILHPEGYQTVVATTPICFYLLQNLFTEDQQNLHVILTHRSVRV